MRAVLTPIATATLMALSTSAFAADSAEVAELKAQLAKQAQQIEELSQAVEATAEALESKSSSSALDKLSFGGYGELHYNNLNGQGGASDKKEIDFHRFVMFTGYEFTDNLRFFSELELEHSLAGDGKPGEVELEQAYIEYDVNSTYTAKAGLFLLPVGFLNETHEPPTFYGVERNNVEKNIIPTTWWEAGAGVMAKYENGVSWGGYVHSGLKTTADKSFKIRNGRQKVAEASADDLAATFNIKYTGVPGLELGAALQYQQDITQSIEAEAGSALLIEAHAAYQKGNFGLRALYATWSLEGDAPKAIGADEQTGFYIEPSYRFSESFGVFARYSTWDNAAGDSADSAYNQYDVGVNWWLHPQVVIKADYQAQDNDSGKDQNGFNLGVGYHF